MVSCASIAAYWIAFGPHGPRAETPKGEGTRVTIQVIKYLLISTAVFYACRALANPPPPTMTKEWQEATNEYALVRILLYTPLSFRNRSYELTRLSFQPTERENGPYHWYQQRRLQGQGTHPVSIREEVMAYTIYTIFKISSLDFANGWEVLSFSMGGSAEGKGVINNQQNTQS